ncbi:MAG: glycerate dehydrogenase, partial [Gammaproteobacteria bacterium]|nr:glycerate dehydrogenase [Gammaproteobacteria bacterium]
MNEPLMGVMLDRASLDTGDLDLAALQGVANWTFHDATAPDEIAARIAKADVVITNKVVLD